MAKVGKPKLAKSEEKHRITKSALAEPTSADAQANVEKKVSQKLLETIERRKKAKAEGKGVSNFGRPAGRRGRRPKNIEYNPENQEDDTYVMESDYEGIEYDTGIRVGKARDDGGLSLDRMEDFDEELNFDR